MISTSKLAAKQIANAALKALSATKNKIEHPRGKQSVKKLIGQNQGVSNIEISHTDLKGFEKFARKYGVDFAIRKDSLAEPPRYLVFFKARDADAMTAAFKEYSASLMQREKKPSVLKQLEQIKALLVALPNKVRNKEREHSL
jgi:hypothetical protein